MIGLTSGIEKCSDCDEDLVSRVGEDCMFLFECD